MKLDHGGVVGDCFFTQRSRDTNLVVDSPCSFLEWTDKKEQED